MILRFTPYLPCDVRGLTGGLCGQPAGVGIVRCDVGGWHIVPICPKCARAIAERNAALMMPPHKRPPEVRHAQT
jgi:hypothetical protein